MKPKLNIFCLYFFLLILTASCSETSITTKTMITEEEGKQIALREIAKIKPGVDFVIIDSNTITKPYGWVFFYTTRQYHETRDFRYLIPGLPPIIINNFDKSHKFTGTAAHIDEYIKEYENELNKSKNPE